jgi:hypothetical protein
LLEKDVSNIMDVDDKQYTERVLRHLLVDSQIDGMKFGTAPGATSILFTHYSARDPDELWLNIESRWTVFQSDYKELPKNEDEIPERTDEESYNLIVKLRRQKVVHVELGELVPHLLMRLESGQTLFVNGHHDMFECWQVSDGSPYGGDWHLVAVPGDDIAVWTPGEFKEEGREH